MKPVPGQRCHGWALIHVPRALWHMSEVRKSLACSLRENAMSQTSAAEPPKAVGVSGSVEGGE
ncbi:hypothetical protein ACRRTK_019475 [Alexandromys fortis]